MTRWVIYQQLEVPRFGRMWMRRGSPMEGNNAAEALKAYAKNSAAAAQGSFMVVPEDHTKTLRLVAITEYSVEEASNAVRR